MNLKRSIGLWEVYCIAAGAMISSGIFVLPGLAHAQAGPSVILSYLMAGLLAAAGMMNTAELVTAMPRAGGDYFFITRTFGIGAGSVSGLLNWFSLSLKSAFAIVGIAAVVHVFLPIPPLLSGILFTAIFTGINLFGSKHAGRLQTFLVVGLLALMGTYIMFGASSIRTSNLQPFFPFGIHKTLATAGFLFVSYGGLIQISSIAEEVKNPVKILPRALILSLVSVTLLYTLMVLVTTGVLSSDTLDHSLTPIRDGALVFWGPWGARLISLAALFAFISTANAGIMSSSRYLFALSRDELLPTRLTKLNRHNTPHVAVLATGTFIALSLMLPLKILVEAASLVLILGFIFSCVCVIVLRESRIQNYRPGFHAPFYPYLQITGILGFSLLIIELGIEAYAICAVLLLAGFAIYMIFGRHRKQTDSALLHLIERLTHRELVTGTLERELREILLERDSIEPDVFDHLVDEAGAFDYDAPCTIQQLFDDAAKEIAERTNASRTQMKNLLIEREEESSTVLNEFTAVPHAIIPGENTFHLILARGRNGIKFPDGSTPHAVFILAGTKDRRNLHLRCLAVIARIAQHHDFEDQWKTARSPDGLKDILLLSPRSRESRKETGVILS